MSVLTLPERKRWYAADFIEAQGHLLENLTTRTATEPSASVEITRNAKGEAQFSVKVYATSGAGEAEVEAATSKAYDQAMNAYDALTARLPFGGA